LKENVTTTQDDQDYHLEISDDNEDMERECDQIIDFLLTLLSITLSVVLDCSGDFSISLVTESTDLE
jgi:protein-tyrosine phosphatase